MCHSSLKNFFLEKKSYFNFFVWLDDSGISIQIIKNYLCFVFLFPLVSFFHIFGWLRLRYVVSSASGRTIKKSIGFCKNHCVGLQWNEINTIFCQTVFSSFLNILWASFFVLHVRYFLKKNLNKIHKKIDFTEKILIFRRTNLVE